MVKKMREITEGKKYISNSNNVYAEMLWIEIGNVEWNGVWFLKVWDAFMTIYYWKLGCVSQKIQR